MSINEEEVIDTPTNEEVEVREETIETPKEKVEKPKRTPEEELAHLEGRAKRLRKDLGKEVEPEKPRQSTQAGELDDTQLDYLDLKGITEDEDIAIIKSVMQKTGQTVREALKDDYVTAKLKDLKTQRSVKAATPGSTKRSGSQASDVEYWKAKYKSSNELPEDFETRSKVVNELVAEAGNTQPRWKR